MTNPRIVVYEQIRACRLHRELQEQERVNVTLWAASHGIVTSVRPYTAEDRRADRLRQVGQIGAAGVCAFLDAAGK